MESISAVVEVSEISYKGASYYICEADFTDKDFYPFHETVIIDSNGEMPSEDILKELDWTGREFISSWDTECLDTFFDTKVLVKAGFGKG